MPASLPPEEDRPGVLVPPPLLFIGPIVISVILERFFPTSFVHGEIRWTAGGFLLAFGISITATGFRTQKRAGTDPIPFNPSTVIVLHGLYRFSRNPMYIGFAIATLGMAILLDSLWTLGCVPLGLLLVDRLIVAREERYLERKFGAEYLNYKSRVRRWL
jgi:protein-S-isoprenylcysteine O-methyltransferase Ste14